MSANTDQPTPSKQCHTNSLYDYSRLKDGDEVRSLIYPHLTYGIVKTLSVEPQPPSIGVINTVEVRWQDGTVSYPYPNQIEFLKPKNT